MSHFLLLVLLDGPADNIDERVSKALAPFQENNMGDCPEQYLQFTDTEEEFRKEYESGGCEMVMTAAGPVYPWDDQFRVPGALGIGSSTHSVPESMERRNIPHRERYATFEEYCKDWHGHERRDEKKNRYGYWENPNRKWDWWVKGGRYAGRLNDGDVASVSEIPAGFGCFAFLTPSGEWIERGQMGWWGVVTNSRDDAEWDVHQKVILEKFKDCTAVVVDCHI